MPAVSRKRDVAAVAVDVDKLGVAQQLLERVGQALHLQQLIVGDRPGRSHDAVAGADQHAGIGVDRAGTVLELAHEAVVQAREAASSWRRLRSTSQNRRQAAIDRSRTSGCSILLNQPMNRVSARRGTRFVNRKFRPSWSVTREMAERIVIDLYCSSDS